MFVCLFVFQQICNSSLDHKFYLTFCVLGFHYQFSFQSFCHVTLRLFHVCSTQDQISSGTWIVISEGLAIFALGLSCTCTSSLFPMGLVPSHTNNQGITFSRSLQHCPFTLSLTGVPSSCPLVRDMEFLLGFHMSLLPWLLQLHYWSHLWGRAGREKKKGFPFAFIVLLGPYTLVMLGEKVGKKLNKQETCLHMSHFFKILLFFPIYLLLLTFQIPQVVALWISSRVFSCNQWERKAIVGLFHLD